MTARWFRSWETTPWQESGHFGYALLGSLPAQWTHLRTYVSWYIETWTTFNLVEPLFVGVYAITTPTTPRPAPPDIAADGFTLNSDWWRGEAHYGQLVSSDPANAVQRAVWPAGGSRLWDIQTNRRPLGSDQLHYWLYWAGPADQNMRFRACFYSASLLDDHGVTT